MNRRRGNRARNSETALARAVNNRFRNLHLEAQHWVLKRKRNTDPPPYIPDPIYQRKTRINLLDADTMTNVTVGQIVSATFPLVPLTGNLAFNKLKIRAVTLYGHAAADGFVGLQPTENSTIFGVDSREFTDQGIQGSRRPCIRIECPLHCQKWVDTLGTAQQAVVMLRYVSTTACTLDLELSFSGVTATIVPPIRSSGTGQNVDLAAVVEQ